MWPFILAHLLIQHMSFEQDILKREVLQSLSDLFLMLVGLSPSVLPLYFQIYYCMVMILLRILLFSYVARSWIMWNVSQAPTLKQCILCLSTSLQIRASWRRYTHCIRYEAGFSCILRWHQNTDCIRYATEFDCLLSWYHNIHCIR